MHTTTSLAVRAALPFFSLTAAASAPAQDLAAAQASQVAIATVTVNGVRQGRAAEPPDPQRTPTSAYRVDGNELQRNNVGTLEELQQLVPGIHIQSTDPSDMQISIRGVGDGGGQASGDANIGMPSSVAVYLDNVYLARPGMLANGLGDVDWIEVLSGAQGTMFGANATGGVLDIHTRPPSFTPEASVTWAAGQRGYQRVNAMLSGPLGASVAGRLNLIRSGNDGAVTNLRTGHRLNGGTATGGRGQLLFKQRDDFALRLSADYNNSNNTPTPVLVATHAFDGKDNYLAHVAAVGGNVVFGPDVDLDDESRIHIVQGGLSAQADWLVGGGYKLRSVTSYRYYRSQPSMADGLSVRIYADTGTAVRDRSWSQELRLDSPAGGIVAYALGLTYLGQHMETVAHTRYAATALPGLFLDSASYRGLDVIRLGTLRDRMLSPFAHGTWHVTPRLDIVAGARANVQEKSGSFVRYNRVPFNTGHLTEHHTLPSGTLVATWRPSAQWRTYAAASYGEKSGGLNISAGAARQAGIDSLFVKPERTRSGEIGARATLAGGRVALQGDVFLTAVGDFQTQGYDPEDQQVYLMNAGSFRARGVEASIRLAPTRAWEIDAGAVYNDAYYTDYAHARCAPEVTLAPKPPPSCNLSGERVFNAPRLTYNASARYSWSAAGGLRSFASARYAYRSWTYGTVDNSAFTRLPGYGLASFTAGTGGRLAHGDWSATVWVNNAFDRAYWRRLVNGDYGSVAGWRGEPRTLGATLAYNY
ncbi:TonB-dependent receptor [Massilia sp. YMA4]|uniref:TonB-dependent receptor n=1 Tax=Massilia sp. YMA4 TaxID=1593482 RepID=UPI000DD687CD|nr:TonB-dependent receptor plug domain-containing protein [Massilia sp. YMA4]